MLPLMATPIAAISAIVMWHIGQTAFGSAAALHSAAVGVMLTASNAVMTRIAQALRMAAS